MNKTRHTMLKTILSLILTILLGSFLNVCSGTPKLDVLNYRLNIEPDITKGTIQGTLTIKFKVEKGEQSITLNSGNLLVDDVMGENMNSFQVNKSKLLIELTEPSSTEQSLTIRYHGTPQKGLYMNAKSGYAFTSYFTSQWMICQDSPGDKATLDISILVPKGKQCVASGEFIGTTEKGDKILHQWVQNYETPTYTYGFVICNLKVITSNYNDVKISSYSQNHTESELEQIFRETPNMISFFEEKSGVKYYQQSYAQLLIGSYYQEMSGYAVLKETYGNLVLNDSLETNLISHELAHQWWGNRITCKNWSHFWLNEAMATFMSAAYNEYRFGMEKYNSDINAYRKVYEDIKRRKKDKPLVFKSWSNPTRDDRNIVYFKGAYVLHLLRQEVGEKAFWDGIKKYSQQYFDKSVTTTDFQNAIEEASSKDLDKFFNEWVY